jgi:L-fuculose-phosphate aldolase
MIADLAATKRLVIDAALAMAAKGLVEGTAGNVSARTSDGVVVMTPSSMPYEDITVDNVSVVDLDGTHRAGANPTSEKALHLACYRRHPEVGGVMHCHARAASMFAVARQPIPPVIEEVIVYLGGDVPVAEYRTTGSDDLAEEVSRHVGDRSAVLMANHGLLAVGRDVDDALHNALLAERTAEVVHGARMLGGIVPLPEETVTNFSNIYGYLRANTWLPKAT